MVDDYNVDIFVDSEGENGLGKDFNLTCITIKMVSQNRRWLLDPTALGSKLFDTPAKTGKKRFVGLFIPLPPNFCLSSSVACSSTRQSVKRFLLSEDVVYILDREDD
jgi:hypothetical protein